MTALRSCLGCLRHSLSPASVFVHARQTCTCPVSQGVGGSVGLQVSASSDVQRADRQIGCDPVSGTFDEAFRRRVKPLPLSKQQPVATLPCQEVKGVL